MQAFIWALLLIVPTATWSSQSSSGRYVLQQSTLNSAGTASQGTGYGLAASLGQETTVGTSSSTKYVVQSAFWAFVGSGLAPVLLTVKHHPGNRENVDLTWTGNNTPYAVFQSVDCVNVFHGFFASTFDNHYDDISPPPATLVCYNVMATAPGP